MPLALLACRNRQAHLNHLLQRWVEMGFHNEIPLSGYIAAHQLLEIALHLIAVEGSRSAGDTGTGLRSQLNRVRRAMRP